jgi:Na+/H+ antiporter NhaD/arsenite permease-like protein
VSSAALALTGILVGTLVVQAVAPRLRVLVVCGGAGLSCLVASLAGVASTRALLAAVPFDVLVMLVALGLLTELVVASRVFGLLALWMTRLCGARRGVLLFLFAGGMYLVSGLVNNLTALLIVLPVLLTLLCLVGVTQRYATWTLGVLLVACNLGGAATPIGDFPAILLLGSGAMAFNDYLVRAAPATALALALLLLAVRAARPTAGLPHDPLAARLALAVFARLYRGVRLDWRRFVPASAAVGGMLVAWVAVPSSSGVGPELIAWIGVGVALAASPFVGERLLRTRVDVETTLFLFGLFVMVGAVSASGVFSEIARALIDLPVSAAARLALFLVTAAVITGVFSAGPSMAALLEVAGALAREHPPGAVYVGLALAVCAGSSLFLTAATAGPLAQALVERAGLREEDGRAVRFGFFEFLPVGLLGFTIILGVGLALALGGFLS